MGIRRTRATARQTDRQTDRQRERGREGFYHGFCRVEGWGFSLNKASLSFRPVVFEVGLHHRLLKLAVEAQHMPCGLRQVDIAGHRIGVTQ